MEAQKVVPSYADEILKQLGGRGRLKLMIGAKDFFSDDGGRSLVFKISAEAKNKIKHIKVHLNESDTYDVVFTKIVRKKDKDLNIYIQEAKEVSKHEGFYDDMLVPLIQEETGLYLSL